MGTVRKYNKTTKTWEVIATSDANAIKVSASELLPEGESSTNVESVLLNMHADINTLKDNVSWLALYGGGGSGGGGSSEVVSGTITVNNQQSGSSIVFEDALNILIKASDARLTFEITVYVGNTLLKHISSGTTLTIEKSDLQKIGINKTFTLSVVAFNSDTFTSLYWDGEIVISTVELSAEKTISFTFSPELSESILYHYKIGVSGNYYLNVNNTITTINLTTLSGTITVNLLDIMKSDHPLSPGVNILTAELINVNNENIRGSFTSSVILTTDLPIIYQTTLSASEQTPTELQVFGNSITVPTPFNVYYSGTTYLYSLSCNKLGAVEAPVVWGTSYTQYNKENNNASYFISSDNLELNAVYKITIKIKDTTTFQVVSVDRFIKLVTPNLGLLKSRIDNHKIFEFCTFNGEIQNGFWHVDSACDILGYTMEIHNINTKSNAIQADTKSLRFLNASYAKIPFNTNIINSNKEFSLHICYKPDYHPDIDRTIFLWNDVVGPGQPSSTGILLKNKYLYIYTNSVITLEEREILDITLTYKPNDSLGEVGTLFVYLDGVIEAVLSISYKNIVPLINTNFYIAAANNSQEEFDYADIHLYNFSMYNICLSPYDVLINRLNNQARVNLKNGIPDVDYISNGLRRNFLSPDSESGTQIVDSILYNIKESSDLSFNNNSTSSDSDGILSLYFSVSNFIDLGSQKLRETIKDFIIPIPILYINVSGSSNWTWSNFISPQTGESALLKTSAVVEYYDQKLDKGFIYLLNNVSIEPQGTSTLADYIKNIDITFDEGTLFSPKETWFPEQTYTLKADIVDSSHSLNPSIGKFVNEELRDFYPFSPIVNNTFINLRDKIHFPKATLKHGVEGFPVLVLMNFYPESGNEISVRSLGIYQFILGRKSPRNLGYEIVTGVINESGQELNTFTYPLYKENVRLATKRIKGYWLEYGLNESFSDNINFLSLLDGNDVQTTVNSTPLVGAFWLDDNNYYDTSVDIKYSNLGTEQANNPSNIEPFMDFVRNVLKLPITVKRYSDADGLLRNTISNGMFYTKYNYLKNVDGNYIWTKTDESIRTASRGDELSSVVNNLNIDSISKFFVVAMLFGLLDNFLKNLPLKFYLNEETSTWEPPLLGIYDTDSGLGQSNQAQLNIDEALWLCGISNTNTDFYESKKGSNSTIIATSNKLWFLDSKDLNYALGASDEGSIYANLWHALKSLFNNKNISINDLADYYWKLYFIPQTEGCGELLFNLTYIAKYITKYQGSNNEPANQINKLHGRRLYLVKSWLTKRIKFLDSMFDAMGVTSTTSANIPTIKSATINAALGPELKITTNAPVVVRYANQGTKSRYIFCDKNKELGIYFGSESIDTSDYDKSHIIYNSDSIIKLGSGETPLYDIGFSTINTGSLPYLTEYNVSAPNRNPQNKNGLAAMDSSYMRSKFVKDGLSELRTIDFRNTYPSNLGLMYDLNLAYGFDKLLNLFINNSCITGITFPKDVSLRDFNISGSNLTTLELDNLNFISLLDLTNCKELQILKISNCANLANLNINTTTSKLNSVEVSSNGLSVFECDNNSVKTINIVSTNLKKCKIRSSSVTQVTLFITSKTEELDFYNCPNLTSVILNYENPEDFANVKILNLNNTKVASFQQDSDILDLQLFTRLESLDVRYNTNIKKIQFANEETPILIKNPFTGCTNLERVFGHISPTCTNVFAECSKFSIHGNTYNNLSVTSSKGVYKTCLRNSLDLKIDNNYILLTRLLGTGVTNLNYSNKTSLLHDFNKTSCTQFDVYYVLAVLDEDKQYSLYSTFSELKNRIFNWNASIDNSPNRYMFLYNTTNITSLSTCFWNSCGTFKLSSPKKDNSGNFSEDKSTWGVLTFLEKCTNLSLTFTGSYVIDRNLFRHPLKDGNLFTFPIQQLSLFNPILIVDDVNTLTYLQLTSLALIASGLDLNKYGDLSEFFVNLSNLKSLSSVFSSTILINYKPTSWFLKATTVLNSFRSIYALGNLSLDSIFHENARNKVTTLSRCFTVNNNINLALSTYQNAVFEINNNTLKNFTALVAIRNDSLDTNRDLDPFTGFNKIIAYPFPIDIIANCPNLEYFEGFFKDGVYLSDNLIELPSTMFLHTPKLKSVAALFYSLRTAYTLTANSFINCPNIKNVSYLFGYRSGSSKNPNIGVRECIPYKLFYHGDYEHKVTFYGFNGSVVEQIETDKTIKTFKDPNGNVSFYQIYSALGNLFYSLLVEDLIDGDIYGYNKLYQLNLALLLSIINVETITLRRPNKSIENVEYCFSKNNLSYYVHSEDEWEGVDNEEYNPFDYVYNNGYFSVNKAKDTNKRTYIWEFDGVNYPNDDSTLIPEEWKVEIGSLPELRTYYAVAFGTYHYCCSPDLLRYCKSTVVMHSLFYNSGSPQHDDYSNTEWDFSLGYEVLDVGMQGKIPPYLLKPVNQVTDLHNMFTNCKRLSYYTKSDGTQFMIPELFFNYTPNITNLSGTFKGMVFPNKISLNVFGSVNKLINISRIFEYLYIHTTSEENRVILTNLFPYSSHKTLGNISYAFSLESNGISNLYITFDGIFLGLKFNEASPLEYCQYVFANYSSSTVRFLNKSLPDTIKFNNYT